MQDSPSKKHFHHIIRPLLIMTERIRRVNFRWSCRDRVADIADLRVLRCRYRADEFAGVVRSFDFFVGMNHAVLHIADYLIEMTAVASSLISLNEDASRDAEEIDHVDVERHFRFVYV